MAIEPIFSQKFDLSLKVIILPLLQPQLSSEVGPESPSEVAVPQTPPDLTDVIIRAHLRQRYPGIPRYSVSSPNCRHTHTRANVNLLFYVKTLSVLIASSGQETDDELLERTSSRKRPWPNPRTIPAFVTRDGENQ